MQVTACDGSFACCILDDAIFFPMCPQGQILCLVCKLVSLFAQFIYAESANEHLSLLINI